MQNPDKKYTDFPFDIKKMSTSGCLFDFAKLNDVSKNVLSRYTAEKIYEGASEWAMEFDPEFGKLLTRDPEYTKRVFNIGRGGKKPRKDFGTWGECKGYMGFFFDEIFAVSDTLADNADKNDVKKILSAFADSFDINDDQNTWFEKIKSIGAELGYTPDMKAYKADPAAFKGSVADVSSYLRLAVTGRLSSPDMYEVMQILGKERVVTRIKNFAQSI